MDTRRHIILRFERLLAELGLSDSAFGAAAVGNHKFMAQLRRGRGVTLTTIERAERWLQVRIACPSDAPKMETQPGEIAPPGDFYQPIRETESDHIPSVCGGTEAAASGSEGSS